MREPFYMVDDTVILNFSNEYHQRLDQLVSSDGFKLFLERYLKDLAVRDIITFEWLTKSRKLEEMVNEIVVLTKQLIVLDIDEIYNPLVDVLNRTKTLFVLEDAYNYWRSKQRFSLINASSGNLSFNSFIEADSKYNQLILQLYRSCQKKLRGKKSNVYRQLQAGTNGGCIIKRYKLELFNGYTFLKNVMFINTIVLKTPMVLHHKVNETASDFKQLKSNPIKNAGINQSDWLCFPANVGNLLCFVYLHKDYIANGLALANLFDLATEEQCMKIKPDVICIYGSQDENSSYGYYYDDVNNIYIGAIPYSFRINDIAFLKEAVLALHDLSKLNKNQLPVKGSLIRLCFSDMTVKTAFISGVKSKIIEVIEAIRKLSFQDNSKKRLVKIDVIFDEAGSLKLENSQVVINGSEIGSLISLNHSAKTLNHKDIERSVFINPETKDVKAIIPITSYDLICASHKLDMVLYVNSDVKKTGLEKVADIKIIKEAFVSKRLNKSEKVFIDIFSQLIKDEVYFGQLYLNNNADCKDGIIEIAKQLLEMMKDI